MKSRFLLLNSGLFPETLPPCFVSKDTQRAFRGMVASLDNKAYHNIRTDYVRYNATKHDGSRRLFGTTNIITYFHICSFIWRHWSVFARAFSEPSFSIGTPQIMSNGEDRSVKVSSLSELSKFVSSKLLHAPFVLKADIAQCFPSLYTHSIPWSIHGVEQSQQDKSEKSKDVYFNELDFHVRNGQMGSSRGVIVGPDAFRLIAELVLSKIDGILINRMKGQIIGAARHVDDYYIGLRTEYDAQSALSTLREVLSSFSLNLNDQKTKIYSSLTPINDLWAQRLKDHMPKRNSAFDFSKIERCISEAVEAANLNASDSPIKILLRSFDDAELYNSDNWSFIEQNIQRMAQKHPHSIDYICLLVAKRNAIGRPIDSVGWKEVAETIIHRSLAFGHHHEAVWMLWLMVVCDLEISQDSVEKLSAARNAHIRSLLLQSYIDGKIKIKFKLGLGQQLSTTDENWLVNLVARSQEFTKSAFSGLLSHEFDHLAKKHIKLIDLEDHKTKVSNFQTKAISRIRYGYDDEIDEDEEMEAAFGEL